MFKGYRAIRGKVKFVLEDVLKTEEVLYVSSDDRFPDWWNIAN